MPSNTSFKSQSHTKRAGPSESSKVFEIDQCMYDLSEDFIRQTSMNDATKSGPKCSADPIAVTGVDERMFSVRPSAPRVHQLWDILRQPISDDILGKLCFSELLLVCDGNERIIGGAAINVSLIAEEVLAAFSSTRLTFPGQSTAESELMSFANRNCRPLQERKCETLISGTTRQEKQIQLYFDEHHNVTAYRQEIDGLHCESFQGSLKPPKGKGEGGNKQQIIVPDGLQLLLLRYLILTNFVGEICSQTVDVQGRVGNCIHKISPAVPAPSKVDGKTSETIKEIRKTIWFADGSEPEESVSHYSGTGRLLRHAWNNSNYVLISNPLGSTPAAHIMELDRGIKDYVETLSSLIKNHSSIKGLIEDIHCSVKELHSYNQIVNPVLFDIINELANA